MVVWCESRQLEIGPEKTECILLCGRRKLKEIKIRISDLEIKSSKRLNYLDVVFDKDSRMIEHVRYVTERASVAIIQLSRLVSDVRGPRSSKRAVTCGAVHSIILYPAPIWRRAPSIKKYCKMVSQVQRKLALRVCSVYGTVSTEAVSVISWLVPVNLQVDRSNIREATLEKWQRKW